MAWEVSAKMTAPNKPATKRRKSPEAAIALMRKNRWSAQEASAWSGIPTRTLYRLLREGVAPSIPMGDPQVQRLDVARNGQRRRSCFRFLIPRVAFMRWYEGIGAGISGDLTGPSAA